MFRVFAPFLPQTDTHTSNLAVSCWFKRFTSSDFELSNEPHSRPQTQVNNDVLKMTVIADTRQNARELSLVFGLCNETVMRQLAVIGKARKLWGPR